MTTKEFILNEEGAREEVVELIAKAKQLTFAKKIAKKVNWGYIREDEGMLTNDHINNEFNDKLVDTVNLYLD